MPLRDFMIGLCRRNVAKHKPNVSKSDSLKIRSIFDPKTKGTINPAEKKAKPHPYDDNFTKAFKATYNLDALAEKIKEMEQERKRDKIRQKMNTF